MAALEKAASEQPKWGAIYYELSDRAPTYSAKAQYLKKATELSPLRVEYWEALAHASMKAGDAAEATRAWTAAMTATSSPEDRERIQNERAAADKERLDQIAEEQRRKEEEKQAEIEGLRKQMEDRIHTAEAKVREEAGSQPKETLPWWDGPALVKVSGRLAEVVCGGKQTVLVIETIDGRLLRLLVDDPDSLQVVGSAFKTLGCGVQTTKPTVGVDYLDKKDGNTDTDGIAKRLEF